MLGLLARAKTIPHRFVILFFTHALCITMGMAYANSWATRQALEVQADQASKREAAVGTALIEQNKKTQANLAANHEREMKAADAAYVLLEQGMMEEQGARIVAERALMFASSELGEAMEMIDGLHGVNAELAKEARKPDPRCIVSAGMRDAINGYIAASNRNIAARAAEAGAAGLSSNPAPPDSVPMTCDEASRKILAIVQHDANAMLRTLSGEAWANGALR